MTSVRRQELRSWLITFGAVGLLFSLWPQLDLAFTGLFYAPQNGPGAQFPLGELEPVKRVYLVVPWIGRLFLLLGLLALGIGWQRRRHQRPAPAGWRLRWQRRVVFLLAVVVFGLGLAVNLALKEGWGRPRPHTVAEFGGPNTYMPVWQPSTQCRSNCSFVSGHAATGFVLIGLGLGAAPARRRFWRRTGLLAGLLIGMGRVVQGDHFASDILFAGIVIWGVCLAVREVWLRRRALRLLRHRQAAATSTAPAPTAR